MKIVHKSDFTTDVLLRCTPVKDQGHTEACWIYAYLACLETYRMEQFDDSLNLSPMWLLRSMMKEQAVTRYLSQGSKRISCRGIGPEAELLMKEHGMVMFSNFNPTEKINSKVLEREITSRTNIAINSRMGLKRLDGYVDSALPYLPHNLKEGFYLYSVHYTPEQFSESLQSKSAMHWYTSYTHHPYGKPFDLEIPDNRRHMELMNIQLNILLQKTITSLRQRKPVYWEGSLINEEYRMKNEEYEMSSSAKGNSHSSLFIPHSSLENRQLAFESFAVTDQHAMAIVGMAHDKKGKEYFICKNSWGTEWEFGGYCYMPIEKFLVNTIFIGTF